MDFKDLNKACTKDGYPLPKIDWKVESLCGYPYKCFLDAYKGHHQIKKAEEDEEKRRELPMLTTPKEKAELIMYLAAAKEAINAVLMTERDGKQVPIYFVSRALQGPEINYTPIEKLILTLVSASKRLKRYFQAHRIVVIMDQPIKQLLSNPEVTGRLLKWRFKLGEHDIQYRPRTSVKGQILAYFIMERQEDDTPDTLVEDREELPDPWIVFTDESSYIDVSRASLLITNPEGMEFTYTLRFIFNATNNEAEYEDRIAGLRIAGQMGVYRLMPRNPQEKLTPITSPWAFYKWGIDIAGPFPEGPDKVEETSHVLWAHRTMIKSSNEETPFSLTYGVEAVIPAEIGMPTLRTAEVDMVKNNEALRISLDILEEKKRRSYNTGSKEQSQNGKVLQHQGLKHKFPSRDSIYQSNKASHVEDGGKLEPKCEGPYKVTEALGKGAYRLRDRN
nr:reverse transcriptase domain-containing protein [Tanacetum cinerariifolium]